MGDLVPGQRFSMRALADRFQTSLIPVRDALKRLVAERGLMMLPNRTVCVPADDAARRSRSCCRCGSAWSPCWRAAAPS